MLVDDQAVHQQQQQQQQQQHFSSQQPRGFDMAASVALGAPEATSAAKSHHHGGRNVVASYQIDETPSTLGHSGYTTTMTAIASLSQNTGLFNELPGDGSSVGRFRPAGDNTSQMLKRGISSLDGAMDEQYS
jgi:transcription initiation factor TFIID subunit TAF12